MSVCPGCAGRMLVDGEPCTWCGGTGDVCDAEPTICETCDGTRTIFSVVRMEVIGCPECGAAGFVGCPHVVVVRESAERAWCASHKPGAPPPVDFGALTRSS